jgi:hypothetical protein
MGWRLQYYGKQPIKQNAFFAIIVIGSHIGPHNSLPCMFNIIGCPHWHRVGVFPPSDHEIRSLGYVGFVLKGTNIEHTALTYNVDMCFKLWQIMRANVASYYTQEWMATTASISIFQHTSSILFSTILKSCYTRVHIHGNVMPRSWERHAWCSHSSNKNETCVNIMLHHVGCPMHCEASKVVANHHNSIFKAYILAPPNTPTTHPKYYTCESAAEAVINCVSNLWAPFLPPPYVLFVWRERLVSIGFALKLVGRNKRKLVLESAKQPLLSRGWKRAWLLVLQGFPRHLCHRSLDLRDVIWSSALCLRHGQNIVGSRDGVVCYANTLGIHLCLLLPSQLCGHWNVIHNIRSHNLECLDTLSLLLCIYEFVLYLWWMCVMLLWAGSLVHMGSQVLSSRSLEVNPCNLSHREHESQDLPLHTRPTS